MSDLIEIVQKFIRLQGQFLSLGLLDMMLSLFPLSSRKEITFHIL